MMIPFQFRPTLLECVILLFRHQTFPEGETSPCLHESSILSIVVEKKRDRSVVRSSHIDLSTNKRAYFVKILSFSSSSNSVLKRISLNCSWVAPSLLNRSILSFPSRRLNVGLISSWWLSSEPDSEIWSTLPFSLLLLLSLNSMSKFRSRGACVLLWGNLLEGVRLIGLRPSAAGLYSAPIRLLGVSTSSVWVWRCFTGVVGLLEGKRNWGRWAIEREYSVTSG